MREIRAAVVLTCMVSAAIRSGSIRAAGAETATQAQGRPAWSVIFCNAEPYYETLALAIVGASAAEHARSALPRGRP